MEQLPTTVPTTFAGVLGVLVIVISVLFRTLLTQQKEAFDRYREATDRTVKTYEEAMRREERRADVLTRERDDFRDVAMYGERLAERSRRLAERVLVSHADMVGEKIELPPQISALSSADGSQYSRDGSGPGPRGGQS